MATALGSVIGTVLMALLAGLPFALAPGMGLNAFFAFSVCIGMGFTPAFALAAVLVEGLIFILLSLTGARTALFNAIPQELRYAVAAGIGLFIMFIGFQSAGFIVNDDATLVKVNPHLNGAVVALFIIGVAITLVLWLRKVKGALLLGILATWILGIVAQLAGWYVVGDTALSLIPAGVVDAPPSIMPTLGLAFSGFGEAFSSGANIGRFLVVTLTFLYVDIFDTLGTLAGVATKAKMLDSKGELPGIKGALLADSIGTAAGAVFGTSTVTTFVESAAGVEEGGRTGLTSLTTAACFVLSIFFFPIVSAIPGFATATALVVVGVMMLEPLGSLKFNKPEQVIPAAMTMACMVTGYSISAGLQWGILSYLLVKIATNKAKEVTAVVWVIGALFIVKMIVLDRLV
jgi:AGZA family xanthine/uracil permease-like MFS transporter